MKSRLVTSLLVVVAIFALACVDMSAPDGPLSISDILLPSPSVIIGDTMRDSNGVVADVRVIAFDANALPIPGAIAELFVTDSPATAAAHFIGSKLLGDRFGTVHLLGQINGLQTPGVMVPVTHRPAKVLTSLVRPDTAPLSGDSTQKGRRTLSVTVKSAEDSASQGIIVHFAIASGAPNSKDPAFPAVYLADQAGKPSVVDTTDAGGVASRDLVVVSAFLQDSVLLNGNKTDTVNVTITASYAGAPLDSTPITYTVPVLVRPNFLASSVAPLGLRRPSTRGIVAPLHSQRGAAWARAVVRETPRREH